MLFELTGIPLSIRVVDDVHIWIASWNCGVNLPIRCGRGFSKCSLERADKSAVPIGYLCDRGLKVICLQVYLIRVKAVSYTHLDVYKRQDYRRAGNGDGAVSVAMRQFDCASSRVLHLSLIHIFRLKF